MKLTNKFEKRDQTNHLLSKHPYSMRHHMKIQIDQVQDRLQQGLGLWTSTTNMTCELVRNKNCQASTQIYRTRNSGPEYHFQENCRGFGCNIKFEDQTLNLASVITKLSNLYKSQIYRISSLSSLKGNKCHLLAGRPVKRIHRDGEYENTL